MLFHNPCSSQDLLIFSRHSRSVVAAKIPDSRDYNLVVVDVVVIDLTTSAAAHNMRIGKHSSQSSYLRPQASASRVPK